MVLYLLANKPVKRQRFDLEYGVSGLSSRA